MQAIPVKTHNLNKLQQWLNYELGGSALFFLSFFYSITLYLAIIAAVAMIPLLIRVLIEQNRYGWLVSFFLFVVLPPLVFYVFVGDWYWIFISIYFSIACFYIYCASLRFVIHEWAD